MATAPKRIGPKKQKRIDRRKSSTQRGYGYRWEKYSEQYRRENPQCANPTGNSKCRTYSECVDHIQPVSGIEDPMFWVESNHQGLCIPCHSIKTATEKNGRQIGRNDYRGS